MEEFKKYHGGSLNIDWNFWRNPFKTEEEHRSPRYDMFIKIRILGDSGTGKTSLYHRFITGDFQEICPSNTEIQEVLPLEISKKLLKVTVADDCL